MAGEFEEPFAISFQADALNSGSVSFGRFEKEELAWERRSSFSHNRYLEEVEKYSKPGSVVQKKAYFEAHFKKKGMLLPDMLGVEYAGERWDSNNGSFESGDHDDDDDDDDDQLTGAGSDCCSEEGALFQSSTDGNHIGRFDEAECEVVGSGKDDDDDDDPVEASPDDDDDDRGSVEAVIDDLGRAEACQSMQNECEVFGSEKGNDLMEASVEDDDHNSVEPIVGDFQQAEARGSTQDEPLRTDDRPEEDAAELTGDNAASQDQSLRSTGESEKCGNTRTKVDRTSASQRSYLSSRAAAERAPSKESRSVKVSAKIRNHKERDQSLQGMKVEKRLPERPRPTKSSLLRVPQKKQSAKSISGWSSTENPSEKPNPPGFSFKSEERAERRKQFYTKLEQKLHAKEAEMNQVQARTQEKTEAEMRRFRQSLNFKATPMPSFYHHSTQQIRDRNEAVTSNPRSAAEQNKSAVQGNGNAKPKPSHKTANKPVTVRKSTPTTDDLPALQMTSNDSIREAARKICSKGKAGPEKVNGQSLRHVQVSGKNNDTTRIKMAEGKQKSEAHSSSKTVPSKSTNPGSGQRVRGVAS